mmetsp:Transcript_29355/g.57173  ORF Transcript_29355/g.57173 Transcript_29355/m.57173 type:complete len:230 (-) Transcript_29355:9504-10193(-)
MRAGDQINDLFGNRGHVIAHAFDVFGNEMEVHTGGDIARILHHEGQEFAEQRVIHLIDFSVPVDHVLCQFRVTRDIGIKRVLEHPFDLFGHAAQRPCTVINRRHRGQHAGPFGHVFGIVTNAFQIGADLDHRQNQPQVDGRGRAQRNDPRRLFVDGFLKRVDGLVSPPHGFGTFLVAGLQACGSLKNGVFDKPAHFHDLGLNGLKITVKGRRDMLFVHGFAPQPIRPVI